MSDLEYEKMRDLTCPLCDWSLHVEKTVWKDFPNHHKDILDHIELKLNAHARDEHGVFNVNSLSKLEQKPPVKRNPDYHPDIAKDSPYIGLSKDVL